MKAGKHSKAEREHFELAARSAVENCNLRLLDESMLSAGERLWVLDHPITHWDTKVTRRAGTLHAYAIKVLFSAQHPTAHDTGPHAALDRVRDAVDVCRRLLEVNAPVFTAAPGTGLEDDDTYAAARFVQMLWCEHAAPHIERLLLDYVHAGVIHLGRPLDDEHKLIGSYLPLDAAIRVGNVHAAAALIRAGANREIIATDEMGRSMDFMAYVERHAPPAHLPEMVAAVRGALMELTLCSEPSGVEASMVPLRRRACV